MTNYLLLLFLYIVWGTTYTAIPFALKGFTPFAMASIRFLLCGLIFMPFTTREDWRWKKAKPIVLGGVALSFANALVMWSQQTMPSGLASLFVATVPLWFMVVNWKFFDKKTPQKIAVLGLLFGILGVAFLTYATGKDLSLRESAIALLASSVIWVVGSLFIRRSVGNYGTFAGLSVQLTSGGVFLTVMALIRQENYVANFTHGNFEAWGAFLWLTVLGSLMSMSAYNKLLKTMSPHVVGTYALVNPMIAMLLGQFFLGEVFSLDMLIATSMVLGGVGLILYANSKKI